MPLAPATPTRVEHQAAHAATFFAQLHRLLWKWAPGAQVSPIEVGTGPNLTAAESVVTSHGRRFRITVEPITEED